MNNNVKNEKEALKIYQLKTKLRNAQEVIRAIDENANEDYYEFNITIRQTGT